MTNTFAVRARTALSPEWDRGFDEAFTDLVTSDPDWVRAEFDALIGAHRNEPPEPPAPPVDAGPAPSQPPSDTREISPAVAIEESPGDPVINQRSPP
jgi:hypothetical protein